MELRKWIKSLVYRVYMNLIRSLIHRFFTYAVYIKDQIYNQEKFGGKEEKVSNKEGRAKRKL